MSKHKKKAVSAIKKEAPGPTAESLLSIQNGVVIHNEQDKLTLMKDKHINTVIFKWSQVALNRDMLKGYFWGFGDILRGMISLYQYCKKNRLNFKIDMSSHPFGKYFDGSNPDLFVTTQPNTTQFYGVDGGSFSTLTIPDHDNIQVLCNVWPLMPLTTDEKFFIRDNLRIRDTYKIQLPENYNVFHLRFRDSFVKTTELSPIMKLCLDYISQNLYKEGDILCSNIPFVKQVAKSVYNMKTFNDDISGSHVGYEIDDKVLQSILVDYQLISNARSIYTYSSYPWTSGFVQWSSISNNKPLIDIKELMNVQKGDTGSPDTVTHV